MSTFESEVLSEVAHYFEESVVAGSLTIPSTPAIQSRSRSTLLTLTIPSDHHKIQWDYKLPEGHCLTEALSPISPAAVLTKDISFATSEQEENPAFRLSTDSFPQLNTRNSTPSRSDFLSPFHMSDCSHTSDEPLTSSRLGTAAQPPQSRYKPKDSAWLRYFRLDRSCVSRHPLYSVGLTAVTGVQFLVVVAVLAFAWQNLQSNVDPDDSGASIIFAYLIIFIVAAALSFILVIDSLMSQNVIQLVALCIFNLLMTCYGVVLPIQMNNAFKDASIPAMIKLQGPMLVVPTILGVSTLLMVVMTALCHKEFVWDIYKKMGASIKLRQAVQLTEVFSILQKFNWFFFLGTLIQFIVLNQPMGWKPTCFSILVMVICSIVMISASIAVKRELRWPLWMSHIGSVSVMAFMLYFLIEIVPQSKFTTGHKSLRFFTMVSFLNLAVVIAISELCAQRFGLGIRELNPRKQWWSRDDRRPSIIARWTDKRMSID